MTAAIKKLSQKIGEAAGAALIFDEATRLYFTGFAASDGCLLVTPNGSLFYTDSRYTEAAARKLGAENVHNSDKMYDELNAFFAEAGIESVALENDRLTLADYEKIASKLPGIEFNTTSALTRIIEELRMVKEDYELENMKAAQHIAERAFDHILGFIKPGITEKDISLELDYFMLRGGADGLSFETIAVSGVNSSLPHGVPGGRKIEKGDFITMDYGAVVNGYHSDMTRTVIVGQPSEKQKLVYETVLEAQKAGLEVLKGGISGFDADKAARDIIAAAGFGDNFGHGTGHGVGVEIHEMPSSSPRSKSIIPAGAVVTVEPGIYLPGEFGVRIEDMAYVTETGYVNLTSCEKSLIIL